MRENPINKWNKVRKLYSITDKNKSNKDEKLILSLVSIINTHEERLNEINKKVAKITTLPEKAEIPQSINQLMGVV